MSEEEILEYEEFNWELKPPYHKFALAVIKSIGWYLIGVSIVLVYTWPFISKKWNSWKKKKDQSEYDAKYHKNVDLSTELLVATERARERMQQKYLKDREIALQKEEERKEKKRQDLLRLQSQTSSGRRLNDDLSENSAASSSSGKSSKLRGEYNPLMGGGGGRYVPPKRSCCKKGGCG